MKKPLAFEEPLALGVPVILGVPLVRRLDDWIQLEIFRKDDVFMSFVILGLSGDESHSHIENHLHGKDEEEDHENHDLHLDSQDSHLHEKNDILEKKNQSHETHYHLQ